MMTDLVVPSVQSSINQTEPEMSEEDASFLSQAVVMESKNLWILSGPYIINMSCNYMLSFISQMFAGHLGELQLAGASIANVGIQGLAYGIMRSMVIMTATATLLALLYSFADPVLQATGQSDSISAEGAVYAKGLIPQLFAFAIYCPMQRFLQAQNTVIPLAYVSVGTFLLHILLSWLAVDKLGFGLTGAALTLRFSWWILVIATALYIVYSPSCRNTWTGFTWMAFRELWSFFKLTAASAFMLTLKIWYFQAPVLISGLLPNAVVEVDSISVCIRVANELGAERYRIIKISVVISTCLLTSIILAGGVLALKKELSIAFTSTTEVIEEVSAMAPLLALYVFLNGLRPVLAEIAIKDQWQIVAAYVSLVTYYIIGLPFGIGLGFIGHMGASGIWGGMVIGIVIETIVLGCLANLASSFS